MRPEWLIARLQRRAPMYAIVRQFRYDPRKLAVAGPALKAVQALHESQPGYAGSVVIDDSQRLVAINLWDSERAAAAGREAIGSEVGRLLEPLSTGSSQLIAAGELLITPNRERSENGRPGGDTVRGQ